jgi:hypothetical protein
MSGGRTDRWRRVSALAAVILTLTGCSGTTGGSIPPTATSGPLWQAPPPASRTTAEPDPCSQHLPAAAGGEVVDVTLRQRYEDLIDVDEVGICVQIWGAEGLVYRSRFPLPAPERDYGNPVKFAVVPLPAGEYTLGAVLDAGGRSCTTHLDLAEGVEMTATALVRGGCLIQVEETAGWSGGELGTPLPHEYFGPGHCGWARTRFIVMDTGTIRGTFVRDPEGGFSRSYFLSSSYRAGLGLDDFGTAEIQESSIPRDAFLTLDLDAELPEDAVDLGYGRGNRRLYAARTDSTDYLYVVAPDAVERWPRMRPELGCM